MLNDSQIAREVSDCQLQRTTFNDLLERRLLYIRLDSLTDSLQQSVNFCEQQIIAINSPANIVREQFVVNCSMSTRL